MYIIPIPKIGELSGGAVSVRASVERADLYQVPSVRVQIVKAVKAESVVGFRVNRDGIHDFLAHGL